jgi:hypothetical protein
MEMRGFSHFSLNPDSLASTAMMRGHEHCLEAIYFSQANISSMVQPSGRPRREAAVRLPDYSNGEQFWQKYALLTHAIELALKAFVRHAIELGKPAVKEPKQHDLVGWYRLAIHYGVPENPDVAENVALLNELHETYFTRYPQSRSKPVPSADIIADNTVDYLIFMTTQAVNPR